MSQYYALVYLTRTGQVVGDLPMALVPDWAQLINDPGEWTAYVPIGDIGIEKTRLLEYIEQEGRFSVAICYGTGSASDTVCQAGPIWTSSAYGSGGDQPIMQVGGSGIWGMLDARLQVNAAWNGASLAAGGGADTTYTSSMQGIAVGIVQNAINRDTLPIDVPAVISGSVTMTYYGYQLAYAGRRLTELTQMDGGPDIIFAPYIANNGGSIRHQMLAGNPTLSQPGIPLRFDNPGNIREILPTRDASKLARTTYVQGNGVEYSTLWASATDSTLTSLGWPLLEYVDSGHTDQSSQSALQGIANADIGLYGRSVVTWVARNRMNSDPKFGSYSPGVYAYYNVRDNPYLNDGEYYMRILGFQVASSDTVGEVRHLVQSTAGEI